MRPSTNRYKSLDNLSSLTSRARTRHPLIDPNRRPPLRRPHSSLSPTATYAAEPTPHRQRRRTITTAIANAAA